MKSVGRIASRMSDNLRFEILLDHNYTYPYLCVYFQDRPEQVVMEIGVTDEKELNFVFFPNSKQINFTLPQWERLLTEAKAFLPGVLANKDETDDSTIGPKAYPF